MHRSMRTRASRYIYPLFIGAVLISCDGQRQPEQQSLMEISKQELADAIEERDRLLSLVKEISAGMQQIRQLESVTLGKGGGAAEMSDDNRGVMSDLEAIKRTILQRRALLDEMETKLENSTINNKELHETLDALRMQIDSQMEEVEVLRRHLLRARSRIGDLHTSIDSLSIVVSEAEQELVAARDSSQKLEKHLNSCYYVVGTRQELKRYNIIDGGFLRKTQVLKGDFNSECFVQGDKRTLEMLPLNSRKAKLLTTHPESSYAIIDSSGMKYLKIEKPDLFWSLSNYLVVQVD